MIFNGREIDTINLVLELVAMKVKKGKMQGHYWKAIGGPWDGARVFMPDGGTMVFKVGPYHGSYTGLGEWRDVRSS